MGCRVRRPHRWCRCSCVMAPPPGSRSMLPFLNENTRSAVSFRWAGHFAQRVAPRTRCRRRVSRLVRRELRLFRPPSLRPRGARGGAQTPGHVHRLDRLARAHALPLGDHRQLRRRGPRRPRQRDRRHPPPRRQRRGARPRPRHPGRHRAEDRALRRRGRLHQAARRRQVRLAARTRRPADCTASGHPSSTRCRSASTSRSTATARPGRCRSTAASPASSPTPARRAPDAPFTPFENAQRAARRRQGRQGRHRHPHPVLGRPRRSSPRAPSSRPMSCSRVPARRRSSCPASRSTSPTSAGPSRTRTSFQFEGGISEFAEHLATDAPLTDIWRITGVGRVHRDGAGAHRRRRHGAHRAAPRMPGRHRPALGHRATTRS